MTPTERADINRIMREDPTLGPRILDAIDAEAVTAGVSEKRREHLRQVGKHVVFRMRQSTSLLIDDYDDKLKKVSSRDATIESVQRRRRFATRATQRIQVLIQDRVISRALENGPPAALPLLARMLRDHSSLRRIPARVLGLGLTPEHIRTPDVYRAE